MVNGVIVVRKEKGMTSFDVVARLRRIFGQKKIGHTGTLDPDAEGVLVVCIGKATKLVDDLSDGTKTYEAELLLGRVTDTQDISGTVLEEHEVRVGREEVREALLSFGGKQYQVPPMYSAIKIGGKKLVDLARKGKVVDRTPREVEFTDIVILANEPPSVRFRVTCSKGAYIRTLCEDVGRKLGCGGCMASLLRTRVRQFDLSEARTLAEIARLKAFEDAEGRAEYSFVYPIQNFFPGRPSLTVPSGIDKAVYNGNKFYLKEGRIPDMPTEDGEVLVYSSSGEFIGVYGKCGEKYSPLRIFYSPPPRMNEEAPWK
ncbi:MAG: tRNA pseudouridine(55) synthase TruB [Lachnospiraceae bacterium]|nr:tRNA pseudouridine(55) synthase TruB [Lachnospiraceae bacterium]